MDVPGRVVGAQRARFRARTHPQSDQEHHTITFEKFHFLKISEISDFFGGVALLPGISALKHLFDLAGDEEVSAWP